MTADRSAARPVLIATSTYPLAPEDGLPRFVADLADALAKRWDVTVLAPHAPGAAESEKLERVEVRRFRYFKPERLQRLAYGAGMRENFEASLLAKVQILPYVVSLRAHIASWLRENPGGLVNTHWLMPQGLAAAALYRRGFAHVATVHGGDAHVFDAMPFGPRIARYVLARTGAVLASSSAVAAKMNRLAGRDLGAVIQPMGVHTELFSHPNTPSARFEEFPEGFLLFVGRFLDIKGVSHLIQAMALLRARHPGLGLVLIGYGKLEAALKDEARSHALENAVRFEGRRTHAEIAAYMRGCRVLVVPSIADDRGAEEGMPAVIAEGIAAGARVVATHTGGIPDVIRDGVNGWLCAPRDPTALARAIERALAQPDVARIAAAARETAARLDWECVAARYSEVFERALARRQADP